MKHFAVTTLVLAALVMLSACETMKGAGRDVQSGGRAVTNAAAETKAQM